jgi:hypothetical protein
MSVLINFYFNIKFIKTELRLNHVDCKFTFWRCGAKQESLNFIST